MGGFRGGRVGKEEGPFEESLDLSASGFRRPDARVPHERTDCCILCCAAAAAGRRLRVGGSIPNGCSSVAAVRVALLGWGNGALVGNGGPKSNGGAVGSKELRGVCTGGADGCKSSSSSALSK